MAQCQAVSSDKTKCDRPEGHYGKHDGAIVVNATGLNVWTWT